jgi:small neutral amino acid transporter SnatA (MarC family)
MSFGLLLLAFVTAVNPCRVRLARAGRGAAHAIGALVALAVGAALAAAAGAVLDAIDVSPESFRLAAGLVLAVEGVRALALPRQRGEPELPGLAAAFVPVAFPLLLQPGVVTLALAAGGDGAAGKAIGALALALALAVLAGALRTGKRGEGLLLAGGRVFGALEVAAGAALAVSAIRDV